MNRFRANPFVVAALAVAVILMTAPLAATQTPPLLDDFNRPDENPLSGGGNWAQTDLGAWPTPMQLVNNSATRGANTSASYWTQLSFVGGEGSVWARSGNLGVAGAPGVGVALYKEVGGSNTVDGYEFRRTTGGPFGDRNDTLNRVTNGARTQIAGTGANGPGTPDSYFNLRRVGNTVEGWTSSNGTSWTLRMSVTDATHTTGSYRASIHANSTASGQFVDDFAAAVSGGPGAATLTVVKTVVNDNGGSAVSSNWTMNVAGPTPLSFPGAGSPGTSNTVEPGAYTVTESGGPAGYTLTYSGDCDAAGNVTLTAAQTQTCVLTNNDLAPPGGPPPPPQTNGPGAGGRRTHGWCGCRSFADPVNSRTGAFTTAVDDLSTPGTGVAFAWGRSYTSADPTVGRLGPGWTDSYSASLAVQGNGDVLLHGEDGQQLYYTLQGGSFVGAPGSLSTLSSVAGGYKLVRTDQVEYLFDTAGRLTSMKDRNAQGITFAYDGAGKLTTITDAASRQVTVSYNASNLVSQVSTPDGRSVSYAYTSGRLTSVTDVRGKVWTYTYEAGGRLATIIDPLNHTQVTNVYDANGRVQSQTDAVSETTTFAWDQATEIATVTDARNNLWKHDYDASVIAKEIDPLNNVTQLGHDADLNESAVTGPTSETTTMTYDAAGNLLTATAPPSLGSAQKTFVYNARNDPTQITDARSKVTSYTYDASGNTQTVTQDGTQVGSYTYDSGGRVLTFTDGNSKTTTSTYDANGNLASSTDPLGNKTTYTYDGTGRVLTRVDPKGNCSGCTPANFTWTYTYNAAGQQLTETDPLGNTTTNVYDDAGRLTSSSDALNRTTAYTYDNADRVLTETAPDPDGGGPLAAPVTTYTYDDVGNKLTETDPRGNTTTFAYDSANRLVSETGPDPDGAGPLTAPVTTSTYDANGNLASTVEPRGNVSGANPNDFRTTNTYDAAGRQLTETRPDPDGAGPQSAPVTTNTYDSVGNLASVMDALNHTTSYSYDAAGRTLTVTAPDLGVTTYTYDPAGNVLTRRDDLNHVTTYAYDDASRLSSETSPDPDGPGPGGPAVTSYTYDENGNRLTLTDPNGNATPAGGDGVTTSGYDRANRLTSINYSDATPDGTFAYDAVGNRTSMTDGSGTETRAYDNLDRLSSVTRGANSFSYAYDPASNLTTRTYPGGLVTSYTYDPLNRLASLAESGLQTSYAYDVASNLTQTTLPSANGHVETRVYDNAGRLIEVKNDRISPAQLRSRFVITLDPVGNPTRIDRTGSLVQTQTYTYDASDRIQTVCFLASCAPTAPERIAWTYDKVGNRLTETRSTGTTNYTYDARDRLLSAGATSYTYDANGNELSAGSSTFTYDLANRLKTAVQGTTTTTYSYDGESKRLQASTGTANSAKTNFLWDVSNGLPQLAQERNGANSLQRQYIYGLRRIRQSQGTGTYYLYDGLGSVANTLAPLGALQKTYSYEPYGAIRTESGSSPLNFFHFTGEYRDPTLLYHLRARQYDPGTGRFLRPDPLDPGAGSSVDASYLYAANRPGVLTDPSGETIQLADSGPDTVGLAVSPDTVLAFPGPVFGGDPSGGRCAKRPGYPLGVIGGLNGRPYEPGSTHDPKKPPHGWQSDNAVDLNVPVGTAVCAIFKGRISQTLGFGPSSFGGARLHLVSASEVAYYQHLSQIVVEPGQPIDEGEVLGYSGCSSNGVPHLHLALSPGSNPLRYARPTIKAVNYGNCPRET